MISRVPTLTYRKHRGTRTYVHAREAFGRCPTRNFTVDCTPAMAEKLLKQAVAQITAQAKSHCPAPPTPAAPVSHRAPAKGA
jgi:hypothetical protein